VSLTPEELLNESTKRVKIVDPDTSAEPPLPRLDIIFDGIYFYPRGYPQFIYRDLASATRKAERLYADLND